MTDRNAASMTAMIIWGAMLFGILNIAVILFFVTDTKQANEFPEVILYGVAVLAGIVGAVGLMLPGFLRSRRASRGMNDTELSSIYLSSMIVGLALMEGVSVLSLVLMLISGNLLFLGIAGLMVMLMLFHIPLPERVHAWMESTRE